MIRKEHPQSGNGPEGKYKLSKLGAVARDVHKIQKEQEFARREATLQAFTDLDLKQQLGKINEEELTETEYPYGYRQIKEKLLLRSTLEATPEMRKDLGLKVFALGPLDPDGRLVLKDALDEYAIYLVYPGNSGKDLIEAYRTEIPRHKDSQEPANFDSLIMSAPDVTVWQEWDSLSYNRHVAQIRIIEKTLQRNPKPVGKNKKNLLDKQLVTLSTLFTLAEKLAPNFPEQYPYRWEVNEGVRLNIFNFHSIIDDNLLPILLLETEVCDLSLTEKGVRMNLYDSDILPKKRAFDLGDSSPSARAAAHIWEMKNNY